MFNEVTFRITGLFLVIAMLVTLVRFVISLIRFQSYFTKMEDILKAKNIAVENKNKTISNLEKMHEAIQSKESEAVLVGAKTAHLNVNSRFRKFVIVGVVFTVQLALWRYQSA